MKITVRAIVPDDTGKILLIKQLGRFWLYPGGSLEEGETPTQAVVREVREETGLEIKVVRLLWCQEAYNSEMNTYSLVLVFLGRVTGGRLGGGEWEAGFFDAEEIEQIEGPEVIRPGGVFWRLLESNFSNYDPMGPRLLSDESKNDC